MTKIILPLDIENLIKSFIFIKCGKCKKYYDNEKQIVRYYKNCPVCFDCLEELWIGKKIKIHY